jgi:uncharacterized protein
MNRTCMNFLIEWLNSPYRKPLVLRGARQVGKTWLVRHLAKSQGKKLVEINLEDRKSLATLFSSNDPKTILKDLNAALHLSINPEKSILFLDEIQAAPELIAKLRWFMEKMPELPVIAAGSLLEFTLGDYSMSMPVGRIEYMHVEPLSFDEFLSALEKPQLVDYIQNYNWPEQIPLFIHEELLKYFKEYIIVGGMPEAVASWVRDFSMQNLARVHFNLLSTYRDDFPKYSKRLESDIFEDVLRAVPKFLGNKFVYSDVNPNDATQSALKIPAIKKALQLLCKARVAHKIEATAANGLPLGAEVNERYNKIILIDVGLCSASLDLSLDRLQSVDELNLINKGGIAEQVVGQLLRTIFPLYQEPALYYWLRTERGLNAEVDYVIQHRGTIVPIEVKAGTAGTLKSLHQFMRLKQLPKAVRINSNPPQITEIDMKDSQGNRSIFQLRSIPFYLIGSLHRLI